MSCFHEECYKETSVLDRNQDHYKWKVSTITRRITLSKALTTCRNCHRRRYQF